MLGMTVSTALAIMGFTSWNQERLSIELFAISLFGTLSFLTGCILVKLTSNNHSSKSRRQDFFNIKVPAFIYIAFCAIIVIAMIIRTNETYQLAIEMGIDTSDFQSMIKNVRQETAIIFASDAIQLGVGYSSLNGFFTKLSNAIAYALIPFLCKWSIDRDKRAIWPYAVVVFYLIYCLSSGGRTGLFMYLMAVAVGICYFLSARIANDKKFAHKFVVVILVLCFLGAGFFFALSYLVGRGAESNFLEYISFYFGGGLPSFQKILGNSFEGVRHIGELTFYNIYAIFYKFGLLDMPESYSISWVNLGGHNSNIFGPFARYYFDFGIVGVGLLSCLAGAIYMLVYVSSKNKNPWSMAIYCYIAPYIFDAAREEFVFSRMISASQILTILFLLLFVWTLTRVGQPRKCLKGPKGQSHSF